MATRRRGRAFPRRLNARYGVDWRRSSWQIIGPRRPALRYTLYALFHNPPGRRYEDGRPTKGAPEHLVLFFAAKVRSGEKRRWIEKEKRSYI